MISLDEILKNTNIEWDLDSTIEVWKDFYIPYYKDILGKIVDFDRLYFVRGKYYRIYAPVKIPGYEDIQFAGDVIVNDNLLESKYEFWNLGLLPRLGNLQGVKKYFGNDKELGKFIKKVFEYYSCENEDIMIAIGRSDIKGREKVLQLLSMKIDDNGELEEPKNNYEAIINFCYKLYGVSDKGIVKGMIEENGSNYDAFWNCRIDRCVERNIKILKIPNSII